MARKDWKSSVNNAITTDMNYQIVKANTLIRKSRYELGTVEQKIILKAISKLKPNDREFKQYEFDLKEFCEECGIQTHGENYKTFKTAIKDLSDNSFWINEDGKQMLCRWVVDAVINSDGTMVKIRLDEKLKPYLLELKKNFTQYNFDNVLMLRSKYSIRLYELFKSYLSVGSLELNLEDLKALLCAQSYKLYGDVKKRIVEPALKEINEYTDINIEYQPIKTGRNVTSLVFTITDRKTARQNAELDEVYNTDFEQAKKDYDAKLDAELEEIVGRYNRKEETK